MNPVEIEVAVSELATQSFDKEEFPFAFLQAFGNKETTIRRLRSGESNKSDMGGVLQTNNIHIAVAQPGEVSKTLSELRESRATIRAKARYILATDGLSLEAENMDSGEVIACDYHDFPNHFGFFLMLAGITTVKQVRDSSFDIRATSRLNRLYVELLKENPEWGKNVRRHEMNHFMARIIFCFFAEATGIFSRARLFTDTIEQMSVHDASNTHEVISEIFRGMNTKDSSRIEAKLPRWADAFPYVNGGLFSGSVSVPKFSKIARSYLLHIGNLDWTKINPDIFGSMIQAVADEEERSELGMHYTSVPNILKVLDPLFLDDLRTQLEAAVENPRMLLNLRKRLSKIRVFDPACGSGNFLVIAYKQMREIEKNINDLRGEPSRETEIPLTNFRGIEVRNFSAEIARLALIIAEYQCNVLYRGPTLALADFLPLSSDNWITCGNALRLDWLSVCPPTGSPIKFRGDDLIFNVQTQVGVDFENEGGETYICSNPPYRGSKWQTDEQKEDLLSAWSQHPKLIKTTDYVTGWIAKFLDYVDVDQNTRGAFVATNSVCQGQQATDVWPVVFQRGYEICFAHTSFKWANLASHNAGVTVVIIGLGKGSAAPKKLYEGGLIQQCSSIGPYLVPNSLVHVQKANAPIGQQSTMLFGNMPRDGGNLILDSDQAAKLMAKDPIARSFIKRFVGSEELIKGKQRYCLWIEDDKVEAAIKSSFIEQRLKSVTENRLQSNAESTRKFASQPHRFVQIAGRARYDCIIVPSVSSESREYLPVGLATAETIVSNLSFALYDAPLWNMALIASKLHLVWIAAVCGKLESRFRYSNTLGWNTFPIPTLTEKNKVDLTSCAENILLARESHFPATIAELYEPHNMPSNLRKAHDHNDEVLERIYIGRRFRNDTERLEKLFDLYTKKVMSLKKSNKGRKGEKDE